MVYVTIWEHGRVVHSVDSSENCNREDVRRLPKLNNNNNHKDDNEVYLQLLLRFCQFTYHSREHLKPQCPFLLQRG